METRSGSPLFATRHRGLKAELARLGRALDSEATILVLGAPGTGKDRLARLIHSRSNRAAEPFLRVDLAAVPDDLFESELFGHEKGAFTGAVERKHGLLEGAGAGTIYLDRLDALPLRSQGKLLRILEEKEFLRVGGTRTIRLEARFVASASPDLPARVRQGDFREDLFYRVAVVTVRLPPLSERLEDLAPAARAIIRETSRRLALGDSALEALRRHDWKGNWRELENALQRAAHTVLPTSRTRIEAADLSLFSLDEPEAFLRSSARRGVTLARLQKDYIDLVVADCGGNLSEAARRLGIARKTLYERLAAR
ncbi:MAG: sigma-54-dependent Fis family transcriptional regulator [Acidobacteria bacterium]|nr:sigma-54-dependent Fis family transcriptional regulator [Acidobacteriota bacterium]MCG3191526.1 Regulatory protein AtoC [Thermoanaerobaculia bacterium]MCK6681130.1 sigma 54-interacting transcriptional regulator [Thermoanaerobaculia bacterium]